VFQYSHEESTRAYDMPDDVPAEVKAERAQPAHGRAAGNFFGKNEAKVGSVFKTLFRPERGRILCRPHRSRLPGSGQRSAGGAKTNYVRIGDFANVQITGAEEFDLFGTVVK
jgi:ribosomal protein S12 methylthiotransferase